MTNVQRLQTINKRLETEWNKTKRNMKRINKLGNEQVKLAALIRVQKAERYE